MPLAFRRPVVRRLALAAAPLLLGAALPRPAAAQWDNLFPACTTRTLAQYLTQLGCRVGDLVVANFTGSLAIDTPTPTAHSLDRVLVQPLALGNTVTFAFTMVPAVTLVADATLPPSHAPSAALMVRFEVFGWPSRPGGSAYLSMLPLAIGNALDADPGLNAKVYATLVTYEMVRAQFRSTAPDPLCVHASPHEVIVPCLADPRGLPLEFDGGQVLLGLDGVLGRTTSPAAPGAQASVTLGAIAVALELPPLPAGPPPVTTAPEPGTWALLGTGLLGVWGVARRRGRPAR